ncbi:MAG: pilus assembly protein [Methylobacterium sp.]|nr:pilus assembly protein [Methylobacterium sp.]
MIAPILIVVFMASIELPRFISTHQNLARANRAMADIIARGTLPSVDEVYEAGKAVAAPFDTTGASIVLTAVGVYAQGNAFVARVCSSVQHNGTARSLNSTISPIPPAEERDRARYVMSELTARYVPIFNIFPILNSYTFMKQVYWPVRRGTKYNGFDEIILPGGQPCPIT